MFLTQVFFLNIHVFLCALSCSLIPPRMSIKIFMLRAANWGRFGTNLGRNHWRLSNWITYGKNPKNTLISRDLFCSLSAKQRPTQREKLANRRLTQTSITKAIGVRWLPEAHSIRVTVSVECLIKSLTCGPADTDTLDHLPHNTTKLWKVYDSFHWDVFSATSSSISTLQVLKTSYLKGRQPEAGWDALKGAANLSLRSQAHLKGRKHLVDTFRCCLQLDGLWRLWRITILGTSG